MATSYHYMLIGALVVACGAVAVFFLRFARDTRDRLFFCFGGAFLVLAAHWVLLGVIDPASEFRPFLYVMRLAAFLLILLGITLKNRT